MSMKTLVCAIRMAWGVWLLSMLFMLIMAPVWATLWAIYWLLT